MIKKLDWIKVNRKYKGLWIALDKQETSVVSTAKDAKSAYEKAIGKGIDSPILFHVPDEVFSTHLRFLNG